MQQKRDITEPQVAKEGLWNPRYGGMNMQFRYWSRGTATYVLMNRN
jgi:hypothetical protein